MNGLKLCAHCGRAPREFTETFSLGLGGQHHNGPLAYWIICDGCGVSTAYSNFRSQKKHRDTWNCRAIDRELVEKAIERYCEEVGLHMQMIEAMRVIEELERENGK